MLEALMGGTAEMRKQGQKLLPRWPAEEAEHYKTRLAAATLFPAYSRTVGVMSGKPFSKMLSLSDETPDVVKELESNIDMQGTNLHMFCAGALIDAMAYGISGVLVDHPTTEGLRTKADQDAAGVRPYFTHYRHGCILGWRTKTEAGRTTLTQLRLLEEVCEDDGDFGEQHVEQVRVLTPGAWQTYRKRDKNSDDWEVHEEGTTSIGAIPFVFFYGVRCGFGIGEPPLLELAHQNVEHWQSSSDQQNIMHVARVPILTTIGADGADVVIGASNSVGLPMGADMKFVEHSGESIGAGRESLKDLEDRMRQTGAELLIVKPGQVTATQVQNESEANRSVLQTIAESAEDSIDQCLQFAADWLKAGDGGSVTLFKDFGVSSLGDMGLQVLKDSALGGLISHETYFNEMKRRGLIAPDASWEDELDRIGEQGPAMAPGDAGNGE